MSSLHAHALRPVTGVALGLAAAATLATAPALAAPYADPTSPGATGSAAASGATSGAPAPTSAASGAAQGYRFWGFYQQDGGAWKFMQTGPYQVIPKDGTVDGWRFAAAAMNDNRAPRATPSFDDICGKTAGEAGKKRVGVVIDYGRKADVGKDVTPPAAIARCASVATGASSAEVLNAVAGPREDKGMVCAIDNWPGATGCGDPVATLSDDAKAADDKIDISVSATREQPKAQDAGAAQTANQGPSKRLLTGIAVVVVAIAALIGWLLTRRRRGAAARPEAHGSADGHPGDERVSSGATAGSSATSSSSTTGPRDPDAAP